MPYVKEEPFLRHLPRILGPQVASGAFGKPSSRSELVAHPLLVGYDLARREDEADLEDHSEELQHEVVDGDKPQQVVESIHF